MNPMAQKVLEQDPDPRETRKRIEAVISAEADAWSYPRRVELRRDGFDCERSEVRKQRTAYVTRCLAEHDGLVVAVTHYVCEYADEIRAFMSEGRHYSVPGADDYGRSDTCPNLRSPSSGSDLSW